MRVGELGAVLGVGHRLDSAPPPVGGTGILLSV